MMLLGISQSFWEYKVFHVTNMMSVSRTPSRCQQRKTKISSRFLPKNEEQVCDAVTKKGDSVRIKLKMNTLDRVIV